jgi:IS30 family transposase
VGTGVRRCTVRTGPRKNRAFSAEEKREVWERRAAGESLLAIARHLARADEVVRRYVSTTHGGVRPRERRRRHDQLSATEREEISRGLAAGASCRAIAVQLGRHPSTVSREVKRNGGGRSYRAGGADRAAWRRALRPKPAKLAGRCPLRVTVEVKLAADWSPQQIAAWLKVEYPGEPEMWVSHETIYLSLYIQSRGALRRELTAHLRRRRTARLTGRAPRPETIKDKVLISQRPADVEDRAVPGHWEGDLLYVGVSKAIGTLVERSSRYVMLFRLEQGRTAVGFRAALTKTITRLPQSLWQSLTWDQGSEMSDHAAFTVDTGVAVYFCDPRSPWQRGSNENTNGLLRQYFPKGTTVTDLSDERLRDVERRLNGRPRQTLGWRTPAEVLAELTGAAA